MTTKKPQVDKAVLLTIIIGIIILEAIALFLGFNGTMLKIVLVILAGLAGFTIPSPFTTK